MLDPELMDGVDGNVAKVGWNCSSQTRGSYPTGADHSMMIGLKASSRLGPFSSDLRELVPIDGPRRSSWHLQFLDDCLGDFEEVCWCSLALSVAFASHSMMREKMRVETPTEQAHKTRMDWIDATWRNHILCDLSC